MTSRMQLHRSANFVGMGGCDTVPSELGCSFSAYQVVGAGKRPCMSSRTGL